METVIFVGYVIVGFVILIAGADRFVDAAAGLARSIGISPLIVGLVIVGFATSTPELLVSSLAALEGSNSLAIGNALGSNITNIGLVIGITSLVTPLKVHSDTLRREFPILFATMLVVLLLMVDGTLQRHDGIVMVLTLAATMYWIAGIALKSRTRTDPLLKEYNRTIEKMKPLKASAWILIGLIALLIGARLVVTGATGIARGFGISDLVIGLTVIAIGTSLPELAATLVSARKGEHDLAVGNMVGSNIFNLLGVIGIPAIIHPASFEPDALRRDYPVMTLLSIALYAMAYGFRGEGMLNRIKGGVLVGGYVAYMIVLAFSAQTVR